MSTPAIRYLKKRQISFEIVKYEHHDKGAEFAAETLGIPLQKTVKTLAIDMGNQKFCLALVPGDRQLSLKRLSKTLSVKRAAMADISSAERLTGYFVGGISPFGIVKKVKVVMEKTILNFDKIMINGGRRGVMLIMTPQDIAKELDCTIGKII